MTTLRLPSILAATLGLVFFVGCDTITTEAASPTYALDCPVEDPCDGSGGTSDSQPNVTISGPTNVPLHQSNLYTTSLSGGDAPFTYQWEQRSYDTLNNTWSAWASAGTGSTKYASVNACYIDKKQLRVTVTDDDGDTDVDVHTMYVTNPC